MRYGIFGGAFDPVHNGHLAVADHCLNHASLDRVLFVPTGQSPHRSGKNQYKASAEDRFEMLRLALKENETRLTICRYEIDRTETSFTVDTLRFLKTAGTLTEPELFLLLGADMLYDLPRWRESEKICRLATPLAVRRIGSPPPQFEFLAEIVGAERLAEIRNVNQMAELPFYPVSSTEIRHKIMSGASVSDMVPTAVERYIRTHRIYGR